MGQASGAGGGQERRKAATRAKILRAADQLFDERGYSAASIEDIALTARVAPRTIYVHFPTKAAIMLAYFDDWMDAFIAQIMLRPVDEAVIEAITASLAAMNEAGWVERVENAERPVHPLVEQLGEGDPGVAGHVLQRWMREMERLREDASVRGGYPPGAPEPSARALAVFTGWIAAMFAARDAETRQVAAAEATGASQALELLALVIGGSL